MNLFASKVLKCMRFLKVTSHFLTLTDRLWPSPYGVPARRLSRPEPRAQHGLGEAVDQEFGQVSGVCVYFDVWLF